MTDVLLLGNGVSRLNHIPTIKNWHGEIWVCNEAYKESIKYSISRVGTVHDFIISDALEYRLNNNLDYTIWTLQSVIDSGILIDNSIVKKFISTKGLSTGSLMIIQALEEKRYVFLCGFDMGGDDIYQETPRPSNSFRRQFVNIVKEYGDEHIHFIGKRPSLDFTTFDERDFIHI